MKPFHRQVVECNKEKILKKIRCKTGNHDILLCTLFKEVCSSRVCLDFRLKMKENEKIADFLIKTKP